MEASDAGRVLMLRHAVATLAYRMAKVLREPPAGFENVRADSKTRSAVQIVAHMADLLEWAARSVDRETEWRASQVKSWQEEIARLLATLKALDDRLADGRPLAASPEN